MNSLESEAPVEGRGTDPLEKDKVKTRFGAELLSGVWNQVYELLKNLEKRYSNWISEDLEWTSKLEAWVRALSYLMTLGRSEMVSELVYSLANIMVLFNDTILLSAFRRQRAQPIFKRVLMKALAIVETFQVCLEMATKRYLGERWKWAVIVFISLFKSISKAVLLFYFRSGLSHCQSSQALDRQLLVEGNPQSLVERNPQSLVERESREAVGDGVSKAWVGSRTNKVVRSIHDDMSRPYDELRESYQILMGPDQTQWTVLSQRQLIGESICTAKPIAHLLSMAVFGEQSLKSLFIPLSMDLLSLFLVGSEDYRMKIIELKEMSRRKISLIYYLLRSPVYDNYVKARLLRILGYLANTIPLFGRLIESFINYLPIWQTTYFYVWAS